MGCGASKKYEPDKAPIVTVTRRATEHSKPEKESSRSKKERQEKEKESTVKDDAVAEALAAVDGGDPRSSAGLGRMTVMGSDYCEKQGIKDAAELLAQEEAFSAALNLKPLERQRLRKQLGRKDEIAKVELEPMRPAVRPAPPPPAPVATISIPMGLHIAQADDATPATDDAAPAAGDASPAAAEALSVPGEAVTTVASQASMEVSQASETSVEAGLANSGGSTSSAATAASSLPASEGAALAWLPDGVYEAMTEADIAYMSDNASTWCQAVGCIYLVEVRDNIEHFSMYMQLTDEEVDLLCDSMHVPDDQRRNSFVNSPSTMSISSPTKQSSKASRVSRSSTGSADCLIELLEQFDPNATGLVKTDDLKHWLATLGMELSEKEADEMIKMACPNADGMVDYSKFVREMMSSPSPAARRCTRTLTGGASQDIS